MRTCDTEMIPQLDGPMSVCSRRRMSENERTEQESSWRTVVTHRREYPDESSNNSHSGRRTYDDRRPPERRYQEASGRQPDVGNNSDRGYSRRGRPPDRSGGPPNNGGPQMVEDPKMMEDPLEMDYIQDTLEDEDHPVHQDPLDQ